MNLLTKARQMNGVLQNSNGEVVDYKAIAETLRDVIQANVFIVNKEGNLPGFAIQEEIENERMKDMLENRQFPENYTKGLEKIYETTENIDINSEYTAFPVENRDLFRNGLTTIVPILGSGERLGTLVMSRVENKFQDEDLLLAEYGATVVGMEILRELSEKREEEARSKTVVKLAFRSLSYSELEAIEYIIDNLEGTEGLVVASKIADRAGITRSVIVNALRKLESAGVIDSRSLGMKGTYIKVLNHHFFQELQKQHHHVLANWS